MKKVFLWAVSTLFALASCREIDGLGISPVSHIINVTAVIEGSKTKVTYPKDNGYLNPQWSLNDNISGFDDNGNVFTFAVSEITEGVASFDTGGYTPSDGDKLYAVYYPGKNAGDFQINGNSGTMRVDLTEQNGVLGSSAPVIMCATAVVRNNEVLFKFRNETAIILIDKFRIKSADRIASFTAKGLSATGTIRLVGDRLRLIPDNYSSDIAVSLPSAMVVDESGVCETPVCFIALPTNAASMKLSAQGLSDIYIVPAVPSIDIIAGACYTLSPKMSGPAARYSEDGISWSYAETLKDAVNSVRGTSSNHAKVELLRDAFHNGDSAMDVGNKYVDIDGCGYTYDISDRPSTSTDSSVFKVQADAGTGGEVTFTDIVFDGRSIRESSRFIVNGSSKMTFVFGEGSVVKNVTYQAKGNNGGVIFNDGGNIDIDGLTISNCSTMGDGSNYVCGGLIVNRGGTVNLYDGNITGCSVSGTNNEDARAGFLYLSEGTVNMTGGRITGCRSTGKGGTFFVADGEVILKDCSLSGDCTIVYASKKGNVTIDNCVIEYEYSGSASHTSPDRYPLVVYGESGAAAESISVLNGTVIRSNYGGLYAHYGKVNVGECTIVCDGPYTIYIHTGGKIEIEEASIVNRNESGIEMYSGTGNSVSELNVRSGYFYCNGGMTGWYPTATGDNNRIKIWGGYFSNNNFESHTKLYTGVSIRQIPSPVYKRIDGVDYSFSYQAY